MKCAGGKCATYCAQYWEECDTIGDCCPLARTKGASCLPPYGTDDRKYCVSKNDQQIPKQVLKERAFKSSCGLAQEQDILPCDDWCGKIHGYTDLRILRPDQREYYTERCENTFMHSWQEDGCSSNTLTRCSVGTNPRNGYLQCLTDHTKSKTCTLSKTF
jgi:hypothetical protein